MIGSSFAFRKVLTLVFAIGCLTAAWLNSGTAIAQSTPGAPGPYTSPADTILYYGEGRPVNSPAPSSGYLEGMRLAQEHKNEPLYVSIKRADEVVNQELASERAKQSILASQFQTNLKRATAGDAESQYLVGKSYSDGLGVEKNESTAFDWFSKSASCGNMHGENTVGYDYLYGHNGAAKDYALALQWLRKAAAQGNPKAQANLGDMYYNGWGVPQDYNSAFTWYRKASTNGNAYAESMIGYMYESGTGTKKDAIEATARFRSAAAKGNDFAQNNLGIHYQNGEGVIADSSTAAFWYRRASRQGNEYAQKNLHDLLNGGTDIGIKVPDNPAVPPTPAEIAAKAKADADAAKAEAARQEQARLAREQAAEQARIAQAQADEQARILAEKQAAELAAIQKRRFDAITMALGQLDSSPNGANLESLLVGRRVDPAVVLGYEGTAKGSSITSNGHAVMFPIVTMIYPDGHEWFRVESGILRADAAQYKSYKRGLEFQVSKVELKGDHMQLKLSSTLDAKLVATVKLMFGKDWQKTMTNDAVIRSIEKSFPIEW
jgi:TPR repeat protein